ncbi:hypothetical protein B4168_1291 [Anoxybacillus flavithermus]|nr:hypothetical protein B4168_1291 [Anoxybacillus flavithermus]OAO83676.1 hypothetical protein GT23_4170 [Parageobacillus thermoglucosidasius]
MFNEEKAACHSSIMRFLRQRSLKFSVLVILQMIESYSLLNKNYATNNNY